MSSRTKWDASREVSWDEVFTWCEDITREYGLYPQFHICPPARVPRQPYGSMTVVCQQACPSGEMKTVRLSWVALHSLRPADMARVALQLISRLSLELDSERARAERAADLQGRLF